MKSLETFVKFYCVRIFNIVQFDYYGDGLFTFQIYKETGIECCYPSRDAKEFKKIELANVWKKDEYLIDYNSMEYQKRVDLLCFKKIENIVDYIQIDIISMDVDPSLQMLVNFYTTFQCFIKKFISCHTSIIKLSISILLTRILKPNMEKFYKHWERGSKISIKFVKRTWEIEIEWLTGRCMFVNGWIQFAKDTELSVDDSLVLYKRSSDNNILNACIFKAHEYDNDNGEG